MFFKPFNQSATIDNVVFEQRNRTYGAYELRSHYADRMTRAFIITTGVLVAPILLYVLLHRYTLPANPFPLTPKVVDNILTTKIILPSIHKASGGAAHKATENRNYIIARNNDDPTPDPSINNTQSNSKYARFTISDSSVNVGDIPETGSGNKTNGYEAPAGFVPDDVPISVPEMPEFPGGEKALLDYFGKTVAYTQQDIDNGINGTVYVQFIVMSDGSIDGIKIVQSIGGTFDAQAKQAIRNMPRWKPGKNGTHTAVPVRMILPIKCFLHNE